MPPAGKRTGEHPASLIKAEMERGPEFLRLANALSALYPKTSEEKRLLDAMLLAVRGERCLGRKQRIRCKRRYKRW